MLILIEGPDQFLAISTIRQLKAKFLAKQPNGDLTEFDLAESPKVDWGSLVAGSLFADSQLVIIRHLNLLTGDGATALEALTNLPASTVAVAWVSGAWPAGSLPSDLAASAQKIIKAEVLDGTSLKRWLERELTARALTLDVTSKNQLMEQFGDNLWAISTELDRLALEPETASQALSIMAGETKRYFAIRNNKELQQALRQDYLAGVAFESLIGVLAYWVKAKAGADQARLTELLVDLDWGLKTGLLTGEEAFTLLWGRLGTRETKRVQWEELWLNHQVYSG